MPHVYKIFRGSEWSRALAAGRFEGSPDDLRDGYIHLSTARQVAATAAKYFAGAPGLVLAAFDDSTLGAALKWEPAREGQLFPHLYGPLNVTQAAATWQLALGPDGIPQIPPEVQSC